MKPGDRGTKRVHAVAPRANKRIFNTAIIVARVDGRTKDLKAARDRRLPRGLTAGMPGGMRLLCGFYAGGMRVVCGW
jgi:hypothetical protein